MLDLAISSKKQQDYVKAEKTLSKAIALSEGQSQDILAQLYWKYGYILNILSTYSEEPSDKTQALQAFEKAAICCEDLLMEFWCDYGQLCLDIKAISNNSSYFQLALECFKKAISVSQETIDNYTRLAKALSSVYDISHDDTHFAISNAYFSKAINMDPKDPHLWLSLAILLNKSGDITHDSKQIYACVEKCQKAHQYDKKNSKTLSTWAEALAKLGLINNKPNLLLEAQTLAHKALSLDPKNPKLRYTLGFCMQCMGDYFDDLEKYNLAIKHFRKGLLVDKKNHNLWHALGYTYYKIALIQDDNKLFDEAQKSFQKAISLQNCGLYAYHLGLTLLEYAELTCNQEALSASIYHFEQALYLEKDASQISPDWLFYYAKALDMLGDALADESLCYKALEVLLQLLLTNPKYDKIHYYLAIVYTHLSDLTSHAEFPHKALCHYEIAAKKDEDDELIMLDWALSIVMMAEKSHDLHEKQRLFDEAEKKMIESGRLGNIYAYYSLACLYSLMDKVDESLYFIKQAYKYGALPPLKELLDEDWLENIKETDSFHSFLNHLDNHH